MGVTTFFLHCHHMILVRAGQTARQKKRKKTFQSFAQSTKNMTLSNVDEKTLEIVSKGK